jgi:CRP-like cAMP-binding protein
VRALDRQRKSEIGVYFRIVPTNAEILSLAPMFRSLNPRELDAVAHRFREDRFVRDAYIFYEGDPAARFWVVKEGQVKIIKYGEGGKEIVLEMIPPGEIFGGAAMLMAAQPATAQALSDVVTISLGLDEYRRVLHEYPAVAVRVIETLGDRMLGAIRMRALASERVERRIAHILLKLATKFGEETDEGLVIGASLARQDIAELADTTVETAIRVMSRFNKSGWVKTLQGGYVVIINREALAALSGTE